MKNLSRWPDIKTNPIKPNSNPISEMPKMNVNIYNTIDYSKKTAIRRIRIKPNQTQNKANFKPCTERSRMGQSNAALAARIICLICLSEFAKILSIKLLILRRIEMNPWFETVGVVLIAVLGVFLGRVFSGLRKPYWLLGYFLPFILIIVLVLVRCSNVLRFIQPFCWIATGRVKFVIISLVVTMGPAALLSRLPRKYEKLLVCILMVVVVTWFSVLPFLVPALIKDYLSNIKTRLDANGLCFQTTDYTCAPAAAVTALGKLGLAAEEGEIAVLSHTSPVVGTLPACLSSALQARYGPAGLRCQYRRFDSIEQLRNAGLALVIVRDAFLIDHCIAVLEVSDNTVTVADPVAGKKLMTREQFEKIWRFSGIVLQRVRTRSI
jgi:hypothetical protein